MTNMPSGEFERSMEAPPFPEIGEDYLPDNVIVHFHFSHHVIDENFEGAAELVKESDIIIPEAAGWKAGLLRDMQAIAKGKTGKFQKSLKISEGQGNTYDAAYVTSIYDTGKQIIFADGSFKQLGNSLEDALDGELAQPPTSGIDPMLHYLADISSHLARDSLVRDSLFIGNLGPAIKSVLDKNPDLAGKNTIRVLCTLGGGHMRVYDYLREQAESQDQVEASSWIGSGEMTANSQVVQNYKIGISPTRTEMLKSMAAQAIQVAGRFNRNSFIYPFYTPYTRSKDEAVETGRRFEAALMDDIENEYLQIALVSLMNGNFQNTHRQMLERYAKKAQATAKEKS